MSKLRRILIKLGLVKAKPHEKAALGLGNWGRQNIPPEESGAESTVLAKAQGKATMTYRVYRAATNTWEDTKEVKYG